MLNFYRIDDALEQAKFQDDEYFENFCSRNVIKRMKSEGQKNTIKLRLIAGNVNVVNRKKKLES